MSTLLFARLDAKSRAAHQKQTENYLKGETKLTEPADGFSDWSGFFEGIKSAAKEADALVATVGTKNYPNRMKALMLLAAKRDAGYSLAGRAYMMKVGYNQKMRLDFEVYANAARVAL